MTDDIFQIFAGRRCVVLGNLIMVDFRPRDMPKEIYIERIQMAMQHAIENLAAPLEQ